MDTEPEKRAAMAVFLASAQSAPARGRVAGQARFAIGGKCTFTSKVEAIRQAQLVRDIFGNPFRPVTFASEWRTSTVIALAKQMYELRDFSAMPIFGDALQDAGCDSDDVLTHCRDPHQVHVRGCWVVDLVLGKE